MKLVNKNTHELKVGDVVFNYGVGFELLERQVFPMRKDDCPRTQGDCVVFTTKAVATTTSGLFPISWIKDYTIQGNKLAVWSVIEAE